MMIKIGTSENLLHSQIWLNLSRDDDYFLYIFLWMITTNKNSYKKILMITIFYCNVAPHPSALKVGRWPLYKLLWMKYKCEIGFGIVNMHMIYNALQKV